MNFDKYATQGKEFEHEFAEALGMSNNQDKAGRIAKSVLHALRDRITVDENAHLLSQLPMAWKGIYVDQWEPAKTPKEYETWDEFLNVVKQQDEPVEDNDFEWDTKAKPAVQGVLNVLKKNVTAGQAEHVKNMLPKELQQLW